MNDNNPEISVVLPAYIPDDRYLGYLYRAVSSLATQTYKNFELILILCLLYLYLENLKIVVWIYNFLHKN